MHKYLPLFAFSFCLIGAEPAAAGSVSYKEVTHKTEKVPLSAGQDMGSSIGASSGGSIGSDAGVPIGGEVHDIQGLVSELGAEMTKRGEIIVTLDSDVSFDFDRAEIKPVAHRKLKLLAKLIVLKKTQRVMIKGHTDSKGSDAYNYKLSVERAVSVKEWLVQHSSISANVLEAHGYGEQYPIAPNTFENGSDNPQGRAKNRRVEIVLEP